jgi:hypothetical protein
MSEEGCATAILVLSSYRVTYKWIASHLQVICRRLVCVRPLCRLSDKATAPGCVTAGKVSLQV